ncbi:MAG: hypothetical protein ACLFR1_06930 [Spirochaetia bacterium]
MKKRFILLFFLSMSISAVLFAQTTEHQRIGVEEENRFELDLEADTDLVYSEFSQYPRYNLGQSFSVTFQYNSTWFLGCTFPLEFQLVSSREARVPLLWAFGDPSISLGWSERFGDTRMSLSGRARFPLSEWNHYAEAEGYLVPGSGRFFLGISAGVSRILDPVLIRGDLAYDIGLPRKERFGTSWVPGIIALAASVTEVLNDSIGYTISLRQGITFPSVTNGNWKIDDLSYTATAGLQVFWALEDSRFTLGFSQSLTRIFEPGEKITVTEAIPYLTQTEAVVKDGFGIENAFFE